MATNLLIVESPATAKTLKKYLGKDFAVLASLGHVRDLVPKTGAVDTENDFAMQYETIARNSKHVDAIAKAAAEADNILLAPDPDREGEAIASKCLLVRGMVSYCIAKLFSVSTAPVLGIRSRTCPYEASTSKSLPRYFLSVLAFAGDSTIRRLVAMLGDRG